MKHASSAQPLQSKEELEVKHIWVISALALVGLVGCSKQTETADTNKQLKTVQPDGFSATAPANPSAPAPAPAPLSTRASAPAGRLAPHNTTIASGTPLEIRTTTQLSTKTATTGERFSASLESPLSVDGRVIAPKGAEVEGVVANSDSGGRVKGVASIALKVDRININGRSVPVTTSSYVQKAQTTKKKDAVEVGIGAGIGAAIGAIAGGGRGAAIGAASGGAAGTGVVLATKGAPAVVPAESVLTVRLTAPLTVAD
jgi:hypothetical protein